ncbi:hypothetical protein PAPYR_7589 [Paratrimastix pyriformis]|uniref:Uncharacterized protein n=1 Tax=Paratrimastix pyriformis TaxID=342808 RepID=A0ABQ8UJW5_9EUKA|nr:hypothetical protein PAPYR_7589 [Paratrimastix pyriformis]
MFNYPISENWIIHHDIESSPIFMGHVMEFLQVDNRAVKHQSNFIIILIYHILKLFDLDGTFIIEFLLMICLFVFFSFFHHILKHLEFMILDRRLILVFVYAFLLISFSLFGLNLNIFSSFHIGLGFWFDI